MRKTLVILLVAGTLVGGAVAYALVSAPPAATAQEENENGATDDGAAADAATTDEAASSSDSATRGSRSGRADVLGAVLDDAVADGVITQEQADQLRQAWDTKREELRADATAGRDGHDGRVRGGIGAGIQDLLDDGVIDADELAGLPDDHPLNDPEGPAAEFLADGQITEEELQELLPSLRGGAGYAHDGANQDGEGTDG